MTEHDEFDRLDRAIEAILAGRDPATAGSEHEESLASLASRLRDLPNPAFRAALAAELFPQPARPGLFGIVRRRTQTMTTAIERLPAPSRRIAPFGFVAATIAAAAAAAFILFNPSGGGQNPDTVVARPDQGFGALPGPVGSGTGGSGIIPGTSGALTYTFAPGLKLPPSAQAYLLRPETVTPERVAEIARKFGLTGKVETLSEGGTLLGYQVVTAERTFRVSPDGFLLYQDRTTALGAKGGASPSGPAPTEQQALNAARAWLREAGLLRSDTVIASLRPGDPACSASCWQVAADFAPTVSSLPGEGQPRMLFVVAGDGQIAEASGYPAVIAERSAYPLHASEDVLTNLKNLRGEFNMLRPVGGDSVLAADRLKPARVTIDSAEIVYSRGLGSDGRAYLVPVFVLRGTLGQEGLAGPVPFATWVPATGATANPPDTTSGGGDLLAVLKGLPVPPGAEAQQPWTPGGRAMVVSYFASQAPEWVVDFYRAGLAKEGWQEERPAVISEAIRIVIVSRQAATEPLTFTRDGIRIGIVAAANEKDPSRGATLLNVVAEPATAQ